ncbi:PRC-barrel domain-containing protein [Metabacillus bambusae]|uniref:PRC-barrel domain-containing protein n=1 Tax=Metabacillus bambusae TaxID=2795218 RepID=A0ABS3N2I0_9BACI|nr:PRC-barrel domain-containing protein [Metabacillus bambusae]MBO1512442.1 PRC-barrel domain-containing protein [Metabacillus bambusae]
MKKSNELLDLPIISISGVKQIGKIKGLIINPDNFSVDFLTVEQEDWQVGVKAVPFKKIVGVGETAVMVEQDNSVIDLDEIPIVNQLLNKKIHIIGSLVLTRKGFLSGQVSDFYFNEENGQLESLLILSGNNETFLPIENVISLGKEHVIINDSLQEINNQISEQKTNLQQVAPMQTVGETQSFPDRKAALKAKLIELLKGNSIKKDIFSKSGELLFEKGTILSGEDIKVLHDEGAKVLIEISLDLNE